MTLSDVITIINLSIYKIYFFVCYLLAIIFSAICFNLMFDFYKKEMIAQTLAAAFMTFVFYLAAEAADLLEELFTEKIQYFRISLKNKSV